MSQSSPLLSAIVLRYTDYGESDRIVHLLTKEHGQISAMVRGARSSTKKYSGLIDLGNLIEVEFSSSNRDLWVIKRAEAKRSMLRTRTNLHKLAFLSYACELTSMASQAGNPEPKLFGLLAQLLTILEQEDGALGARFRIAFEIKLLSFAGYMPQLHTCPACQTPVSNPTSFFYTEASVFHRNCLPSMDNPEQSLAECSTAWLQASRSALHTPMLESLSIPMPNGPQWCFSRVISIQYQKKILSRSFLQSIEST
jgi:DNA repair protein RecO